MIKSQVRVFQSLKQPLKNYTKRNSQKPTDLVIWNIKNEKKAKQKNKKTEVASKKTT